jgi:succinate dehydrogenase/fumarate reductase flavoprotein subunit
MNTSQDAIVQESDVLVIGSGLAGCLAAIKARQSGAENVIQICKGLAGSSGQSAFAAGGMTYFSPEEEGLEWAFREIVEKAGYQVDQDRLWDHMNEIADIVGEMDSYGVQFEKTADGKLARYMGRGNIRGIVFHGGAQMMKAMAKAARQHGVKQINRLMMTDLLTFDRKVVGALAFDTRTGELYIFKAKATVLATGPVCYKSKTAGVREVTGDGQVAAYQAGCDISGLDIGFFNVRPSHYDIGPGTNLYQGHGWILTNARGEKFMEKYDPILKDRALLSSLPAYMAMEVKQGNGPLYAKMSHFAEERVQKLRWALPLPFKGYERIGIVSGDRFVKDVEWIVSGPRLVCGPLVNTRFETRLPGLYSCGDAISNAGEHGGQRELVGAATSGARAGRFAAEYAKEIGEVRLNDDQVEEFRKQAFWPLERDDGIEPDQVVLALQEAIYPYDVFILKTRERLENALREVTDIMDNQVPLLFAYDPHYLRMALEARNMVITAEMEIRGAIAAKTSKKFDTGLREDYPYNDYDNWLNWVGVEKADGKMQIIIQDLPVAKYPLKPPSGKVLDERWQRARELGLIKIEEGRVVWV